MSTHSGIKFQDHRKSPDISFSVLQRWCQVPCAHLWWLRPYGKACRWGRKAVVSTSVWSWSCCGWARRHGAGTPFPAPTDPRLILLQESFSEHLGFTGGIVQGWESPSLNRVDGWSTVFSLWLTLFLLSQLSAFKGSIFLVKNLKNIDEPKEEKWKFCTLSEVWSEMCKWLWTNGFTNWHWAMGVAYI